MGVPKKQNSFKAKGCELIHLPDGNWTISKVQSDQGQEIKSKNERLIKAIFDEGQERGWYGWKAFGLYSAFCSHLAVNEDIQFFSDKAKHNQENEESWLKSGDISEPKLIKAILKNADLKVGNLDFWKKWTNFLNGLQPHQKTIVVLLNGMYEVNFFYSAAIATGLMKPSEFFRCFNPGSDQIDDWKAYKAIPVEFIIMDKYLTLFGK